MRLLLVSDTFPPDITTSEMAALIAGFEADVLDDEAAFLAQVRQGGPHSQDAARRAAARNAALDLSWKRVIEQFETELTAASDQEAQQLRSTSL